MNQEIRDVSAVCVAAGFVLWHLLRLQPRLQPSAEKLYAEHCASCHGADRLGGIGPALLPENLARLRRPEAFKTIAEGRMRQPDGRVSPTSSPRRRSRRWWT